MKTLIYCLNKLKIEKDSEIYTNALALVQKVPLEFVNNSNNGSNEWINAMKIIAYAYYSVKNNNNNDNDTSSYIFSQSQLSDFLTLSANGIEEKRMSSEIINSIIFKIYRDITENYQELSQSLKSNYPIIIVDVVSIIKHGMDTKGTKVSSIGIEKYYQSRKQQATMTEEGEEETARTAATTSAAICKDKIRLSSLNLKSLVENLSQITNRERKELEESLARLRGSDLKKISELCHNHSRLQYYSKLITKEGSQEEFKNEIQRELGRKLRSHQLGRAANSIRRLQTYIENILDNKFIPDASHGINHVKHNIEYGYQLMNLIERTRRQRDQ